MCLFRILDILPVQMYGGCMTRRLNLKTLKQQVYDYLAKEIRAKRLKPGEKIRLDATAAKLGVSRTPLREALMQLEMEGFVTIVPRVGIQVNELTLADIRSYYEVIGSLEAAAVRMGAHRMTGRMLDKMENLNRQMADAIEENDFARFYRLNIQFHDGYILPAENPVMHGLINNLKRRLYDFLPSDRWEREWEIESLDGHQLLIEMLKTGRIGDACQLLTDRTWNFDIHACFIGRYYGLELPPALIRSGPRINPYRE